MVEARVERRLAAIFAADVAGYSRLMGRDEVRTLAGFGETADLKLPIALAVTDSPTLQG